MVDANYFPQFNSQLLVEDNCVLLNNQQCNYTLSISLYNQKCVKIPKEVHKNSKTITTFLALYGIVPMEINQYLLVVTKASIVGQIFGKKILVVEKIEFICLAISEDSRDKLYVEGLSKLLHNCNLYFSEDYDITLSLQNFVKSKGEKQVRKQFMFNEEWTKSFELAQAFQWINAFVSGYISIKFVQLTADISAQICLITRRDKRRQGIRYFTRGLNQSGNVANACETQLILSINEDSKQHYFSYVQLRGSIPVYWKQQPNLKFKPQGKPFKDLKQNKKALTKLYDYLKSAYKEGIFINLMDKKGFEKQLSQSFERVNYAIEDHWRYVQFDFHAQCKNMKYQNVAKLIDMVEAEFIDYGYYHLQSNKPSANYLELKSQTGIFRANCVDSLDRTNVVQSSIAKAMLIKWLTKIESASSQKILIDHKLPPALDKIFRSQWAQNANALSLLYAGTQAMKNDFTAFGKRTAMGALKDAKIGIQRYLLGNFYDSRKEDFVHFSLGKIQPHNKLSERIHHSSFNSIYLVGLLMISVPFIVSLGIDHNSDEETNNTALKIGITAVGWAILVKGFQLFHKFIVRRPIEIKNE